MKPKTFEKPDPVQTAWNAFTAEDRLWLFPVRPAHIDPKNWNPRIPDRPPVSWWASLEAVADALAEAGESLPEYWRHNAAVFLGLMLENQRVESKYSSLRAAAAMVIFAKPLHEVPGESLMDVVKLHKGIPGSQEQLGKVLGVPKSVASEMLIAAEMEADERTAIYKVPLAVALKRMLPKGWRNPTEIERQRLLDQFQAEYERAAELWPRMRKRFNDSLPAGKSPMATILAGA